MIPYWWHLNNRSWPLLIEITYQLTLVDHETSLEIVLLIQIPLYQRLPCLAVLLHAEQYIPKMGEVFSYKDISQEIYVEKAANKKNDPANSIFEAMRNKRKIDMANPNAPQAFVGADVVQPEFSSSTAPWQALEAVFPSDWEAIKVVSPTELSLLRSAVKVKTVLDHPDFKIIELALAPGALLPRFAEAAPGSFHVLEGAVEVTVDDDTIAGYTGTSVKLESLSQRRIKVISAKPAKILWFRWAPEGDQAYLNYGYYLTGCNFHAKVPEQLYDFNMSYIANGPKGKYVTHSHATPEFYYVISVVFSLIGIGNAGEISP